MHEATGSPSTVTSGPHRCTETAFTEFPASALESSLVARFHQQVAAHRDCLAVRDPSCSLSYGELDGWSNGIARAVLERVGEGPEPVALVFAQGAASCAAVLGALESGRPYVSLDPGDPRRAATAAAVGARIALTDVAHRAATRPLADAGLAVVAVDEVDPSDDPGIPTSPASLAYVFFTSGSTGRPKGVYDCHRNVLHNVLRYTNALGIEPTDRLSLVQAPSFSACVSSLFAALLNGAAVFPFSIDEHGANRLAGWLREQRISIYHSVPSIFRRVLRDAIGLPDIRLVRLEGDRASSLDVELHRRYLAESSVLVNGLGATETGIARQLFVDRDTRVEPGILPVGYPVADMDVVVVDDDGSELPPGRVGEIVVRSRYLALGYWNRPDLTDRAFTVVGDVRGYRTGDLGCLRADGCLEYLGRKDGELKVLGHRVEPAEVEAELVRVRGVREAAVTTREGLRGEAQLVAYVVPDGEQALSTDEIRRSLAARLPQQLVPSTVVELEELPLGPNGKVDRRALPAPARGPRGRAPADDEQRRIARIWQAVLEVGPIGVDDDFFELGGDSLAAAEALAQLELETGRHVSPSVLAGAPTVARLAEEIRPGRTDSSSSLVVLRADGAKAPLVLVHGNTGDARHYADLVRALDGDRPLWALEDALPRGDLAVEAIAARHVSTLEARQGSGPFLLAGFCYGGTVAHEIACQLRNRGHEVALLALLGVTPLEFPTMLAPDAYRRWRLAQESRPFVARARLHLARARRLPPRERLPYVAQRGVNLIGRARSRLARRAEERPLWIVVREALARHEPQPCPGRALLVIHEEDSAGYTDDPEHDWAGLTTGSLDVEVLPGSDHAMLQEPGVERLAALLETRLATCP